MFYCSKFQTYLKFWSLEEKLISFNLVCFVKFLKHKQLSNLNYVPKHLFKWFPECRLQFFHKIYM